MSDIEILSKVAKELNKVMGLNPQIDVKQVQDLYKQIERNALGKDEQGKVDSDEALSTKMDEGKFSREVEGFLDSNNLLPEGWALLPNEEKPFDDSVVMKTADIAPVAEQIEEKESTETKAEEEKVSKKKKGKKAKAKVSKKIREKKETTSKKTTTKSNGVNKNKWGVRKGTKADKTCELFAAGKYTMSEIKKKIGDTQYNLAKRLSVKKNKEGILSLK